MQPRKLLVNSLIKSLNENVEEWQFDEYTATNIKTGVEIWIANVPILNISLFKPTTVSFSLWDKIRIYKAMNKCRCLKVLSILGIEYEPQIEYTTNTNINLRINVSDREV